MSDLNCWRSEVVVAKIAVDVADDDIDEGLAAGGAGVGVDVEDANNMAY
jgi:hypothetical protein